MKIEKTAKNKKTAYKKLYYFNSARDAFEEILKYYKNLGDYELLLPGYIGISANEGSGIYDPVIATEMNHCFYEVDRKLHVKTEDFESKLKRGNVDKIVLLVHYFGYPDPKIREIVELCKQYKAVIIEDAAHGLYTDFIDHSCGNYGDYTLYSLHKMLPLEQGGLLKLNIESGFVWDDSSIMQYPVFDYDLYQIAQMRKMNAKMWSELLDKQEGVEILRAYTDNVTPQTFPIIVTAYDRNQLYFKLNEVGFGAVSLYHTMIDPIQQNRLQDAIWMSQHIINMPVHQDVDCEQIKQMCKLLLEIVNGNNE